MTVTLKLPEVTPCVLFKRIVPHLRANGWEVTRGHGLEEGDRIYRPGCKAMRSLAERDQHFFLCYDGYKTNQALVDFVFDNGILTPEQVWTPSEMSTTNDVEEKASALSSQPDPETQIKPKSHQKRKRKTASTTKKKKATGDNEPRQAKRSKKKAASKQQRHAEIPEQQRPPIVDMRGLESVATAAPENVKPKRVGNAAGDSGRQLLQDVKLHMLDFVTLVNRSWRACKNSCSHGDQIESLKQEMTALAADIRNSRQDLNLEIEDVVACSQLSSGIESPRLQPPLFQLNEDGVLALLRDAKVFMQQFVVVVRHNRRLLSTNSSALSEPLAESDTDRTTECDSIAREIALLCDDLHDGVDEMVAVFEQQPSIEIRQAEKSDSENTDTDEEL